MTNPGPYFLGRRRRSLFLEFECHYSGIDQHLSGVLEVYGYAIVDCRLHLPPAPFRAARMADPLARFDRSG
jgi:hypothetical protein